MSALRIITGMMVDEFAARGAPLLPGTQPVGRAQPCRAGMDLCDKRRAIQPWRGRRCRAPGVLAGIRGRRFARAARNAG
jgi:hypothetical protein